FFFQAEDGIRDFHVTGVQTCALPISEISVNRVNIARTQCVNGFLRARLPSANGNVNQAPVSLTKPRVCSALKCHGRLSQFDPVRSEERRVGKECRSRWWESH